MKIATLRRKATSVAPLRFTVFRGLLARVTDRRTLGRLGDRSVIVPPAEVQRPERLFIGDRVILHEESSIQIGSAATSVTIGDGTRLSRFVHIACAYEVVIGRNVSSSDHATIVDTWGPVDPGDDTPPGGPVTIGDGAYLGYGCIVGPGVTVGENAFVGEGAVVFDDVPARSVVYGNPAVPVRTWSAEGWEGVRHP